MSPIHRNTAAMAAMAAAAVASSSMNYNRCYAESSSWFSPFYSSRSSPENDVKSADQSSPASAGKSADEDPGGRASGFDPESLERGAKALREINSSSYAKQVWL